MNGHELIHECVGYWTDDGEWQVSPGEPIVRCKDCKHVYEHHDARGRWLLCNLQVYFKVKPYGFCAWGETEEDNSDDTD